MASCVANQGASGLRGQELGRWLLPALGDTGRGGDGGWEDGTTGGPRLPLPKSEAHACLCLCLPRWAPRFPRSPLWVPGGPTAPASSRARRDGRVSRRGRESRLCEPTASISLSVKQGWAEAGYGSIQKSWVRHWQKRGAHYPPTPVC